MSGVTAFTLSDLLARHSSAKVAAATSEQIDQWKFLIPDWIVEARQIAREFKFKDFYQTMAFVNAVAWIAHSEDHHPELNVGYNRCVITFSTHSVGGLSENDFICAAKVSALKTS